MNAPEFPYQQPLTLEYADFETTYSEEDAIAMINGPGGIKIFIKSTPEWIAPELAKLTVNVLRKSQS